MANTESSDNLVRIIVLILAVLVLSPVVMMLFAVPMWGMMGTWGGSGGMMNGAVSPLWGIGTSLVWLAVLVGIGYVIYRGFVGREAASDDPAVEELRLAYARGDLSDEEFAERRETLQRDT